MDFGADGAFAERLCVRFRGGAAMLGGAEEAVVLRIRPESPAVVLASPDGACSFLLGDPAVALPEWKSGLSEEEALRFGEGADRAVLFCRVVIPENRPSGTGFDLGRLVAVDPETGSAMEVSRPGGRVVPLLEMPSIMKR